MGTLPGTSLQPSGQSLDAKSTFPMPRSFQQALGCQGPAAQGENPCSWGQKFRHMGSNWMQLGAETDYCSPGLPSPGRPPLAPTSPHPTLMVSLRAHLQLPGFL